LFSNDGRELWLFTHEKVVGVGDVATNAEELHEIMELAVDITAYLRVPSVPVRSLLNVHSLIPLREL
jgi:hypothetical protein